VPWKMKPDLLLAEDGVLASFGHAELHHADSIIDAAVATGASMTEGDPGVASE
jgi:hypothetical protein